MQHVFFCIQSFDHGPVAACCIACREKEGLALPDIDSDDDEDENMSKEIDAKYLLRFHQYYTDACNDVVAKIAGPGMQRIMRKFTQRRGFAADPRWVTLLFAVTMNVMPVQV